MDQNNQWIGRFLGVKLLYEPHRQTDQRAEFRNPMRLSIWYQLGIHCKTRMEEREIIVFVFGSIRFGRYVAVSWNELLFFVGHITVNSHQSLGFCSYIRDYYDDPEVLITRNGWSDDGEFIDLDRIDYLAAHMEEVLKAVNDGYNVVGYTGNDS